jgi:hypothetical protein
MIFSCGALASQRACVPGRKRRSPNVERCPRKTHGEHHWRAQARPRAPTYCDRHHKSKFSSNTKDNAFAREFEEAATQSTKQTKLREIDNFNNVAAALDNATDS